MRAIIISIAAWILLTCFFTFTSGETGTMRQLTMVMAAGFLALPIAGAYFAYLFFSRLRPAKTALGRKRIQVVLSLLAAGSVMLYLTVRPVELSWLALFFAFAISAFIMHATRKQTTEPPRPDEPSSTGAPEGR